MLDFPVLPEFKFSWRVIYIEPIYGSGEKIAVAVILKGWEARFELARAPRKVRLCSADSRSAAYTNSATPAKKFYPRCLTHGISAAGSSTIVLMMAAPVSFSKRVMVVS